MRLIVVSTPASAGVDERFGYQYGFAADVDIPDPAEPVSNAPYTEGCTCRAAGPAGLLAWLGLVPLIRRRRGVAP